ncbi:ArdC family protein [Chromobacterium vaccinii]|uniref:ArdC family protein n=1 Tax=Chromobacterium vaccinii TaxID=1108595 RepID=UPI0031E373A6
MGAREFRQRRYVEEAVRMIDRHLELAREGLGWFRGGRGFLAAPFNPLSGARYQGINRLLLEMAAPSGSDDPRWLSWRQIEQRREAIQLADGARAGLAIYARPIPGSAGRLVCKASGAEREQAGGLAHVLKGCSVFNGADVAGLPPLAEPTRRRGGGDEYLLQLVDAVARELGGWVTMGYAIPPAPADGFADMRAYAGEALRRIAFWRACQPPPGPHGAAGLAARARIAAFWLADLAGCGCQLSADADDDLASWGECLRTDPLEAFRAAAAAERIVAWLCRHSPSLSRLLADEDDFIRRHSPLGIKLLEHPPEDGAVLAWAAVRGALSMEASLLTAEELAQCLSAHFGCQEVLSGTDEAIHQAFQAWARQAIESGAFDDAKLTGRQLLSRFLEQREAVVLGFLERDDGLRRQMRAASAINMENGCRPLAAEPGAGQQRRLSAQPLRSENGNWLGVRHGALIALGMADRMVDENSRMSPDMVYLSCNEGGEDCDAQRLLAAAEAAGWRVDFQPDFEPSAAEISGYAGYFAPLVGYQPKVGDRLKLVEGPACIHAQSTGGGWVVRLASGKRRVLSHARFCDFIESVIDGDYIVA